MESWKINKALITAAGPDQRKLPLQTLIDRKRMKKTVLEILIDEISAAGIPRIGVVIHPDDENIFRQNLSSYSGIVEYIPQNNARGYGHAILCAAAFLKDDPFLHLVGDHLYVNQTGDNIAQQVVEVAQKNSCSVSVVQQTRETLIGNYGTIGADRIRGSDRLYRVNRVIEKPVPSYAEQHLMVPGLRTGYYLCFFGMHVFSPSILDLLGKRFREFPDQRLGLSESLNELSRSSKYLAIERNDMRFDIGQDYGLFKAQLALSLTGMDRELILTELLKFFGDKERNNN
jgi:UTP--glucose-1-phosphate uridylyltransferase